jgi:hypothetical protein
MKALVVAAIAVLSCPGMAASATQEVPGTPSKPALGSTMVAQASERQMARRAAACRARCTSVYNACVHRTRRIANPERLDAAIRNCSTTNNYCQTACEGQ